MKVQELMTQEVVAIGLERRLDEAVALMWEHDFGSLPVVDAEGRIVAMLTDRDACMHAWSQGRAMNELGVSGAMSRSVVACKPNDSVARAERLMQRHQIRRLPVVDGSMRPLGILSLSDLSREAMREHGLPQPEVGDPDVAHTLAAVCQPRRTNGVIIAPAGLA